MTFEQYLADNGLENCPACQGEDAPRQRSRLLWSLCIIGTIAALAFFWELHIHAKPVAPIHLVHPVHVKGH